MVTDSNGEAALDRRVGEARFVQRVFDEMPLIVVAFEGAELRIAATTSAYRRFVGRESVVGTSMRDAFAEMTGQQLMDIVERCYSSGQATSLREVRILMDRPDAGDRVEAFLDIVVRPRRGEHGEITAVIAHLVDVTERARERQAVQARAATAERRYEQARTVIDLLQRELLPVGVPVVPGVEIAASYLLAEADRAAGGDWFDAVPLPDGRVALVVGDVVGHGVRASATMGQLRVLLSDFLRETGDIGVALEALDRTAMRMRSAWTATLCVAILDATDGTLSYCTAGHPAPLVVSPRGEPRYLTPSRAGPLATGTEFTLGHDRLEPDDLLLLYTDGILERPGRTLAGTSVELAQVVADVAAMRALPSDEPTTVERVCTQSLELLTRVTGHTDDITLLAAQRVRPVADLALEAPAVPGSLAGIRAAFAAWLDRLHVARDDAHALQHAVGELVTNAVEHAYRGAPEPGPVSVTAALTGDGEVRAVVRDEGSWKEPDVTPERGRGLSMTSELVDELAIEHPGGRTVAFLRRALTRPARLLTADAFGSSPVPAAISPSLVLDSPAPGRLCAAGPLDTATAPALAAELLRLTAAGTRPLTLDLTAVTHLASAGVSVLHEADVRSLANGTQVRLLAMAGSPAHQVLVLVRLPHLTEDRDQP